MACSAWAVYKFADDDQIAVGIDTDAAPHPDLIDELRRNVRELYAETLGVSVEALASDDTRET